MCWLPWVQFKACGCYRTLPEIEEDPKCPFRASLGDQVPPGKHIPMMKQGASRDGYCLECVNRTPLEKELIEIEKLARVEGETFYVQHRRREYWKNYEEREAASEQNQQQ
jgi:hypothetical protein